LECGRIKRCEMWARGDDVMVSEWGEAEWVGDK